MAKLQAISPLAGYDQYIGTMRLRELADIDLVALAIPQGPEAQFKTALKKHFNIAMPTPLKSTTDGKSRLMMTQPDQVFVLQTGKSLTPESPIVKTMGTTAYVTDQSDAWVVLELSGPSSRDALERICQLDLDADVFELNAMARTTLEHMGSIIVRTEQDTFLLMSASSSAASFLHAVELSAQHVS